MNETELTGRDDALESARIENMQLRNEVFELKVMIHSQLAHEIAELKERVWGRAIQVCVLTAVVVFALDCNHTNKVRDAARDALYERIGKVLTEGDVDAVSERMRI